MVVFHMTPLAVDMTKKGASIRVRASFTPGTLLFRRMEMRKPVTVHRTSVRPVMRMVCQRML